MQKKAIYKIIDSHRVMVEYYSGVITVPDLIQLKQKIKTEPNYQYTFSTLLDFRDCFLNITGPDLEILLQFFLDHFKNCGSRTVAYLTSKPNDVVLSTIWSHMVLKQPELATNPMIFSTIESAANFILQGNDQEVCLESVLELLKNTNQNALLPANQNKIHTA